jgi:hypothetical protein
MNNTTDLSHVNNFFVDGSKIIRDDAISLQEQRMRMTKLRAKKLLGLTTDSQLARALGVSRQYIHKAMKPGQPFPKGMRAKVETILAGAP